MIEIYQRMIMLVCTHKF